MVLQSLLYQCKWEPGLHCMHCLQLSRQWKCHLHNLWRRCECSDQIGHISFHHKSGSVGLLEHFRSIVGSLQVECTPQFFGSWPGCHHRHNPLQRLQQDQGSCKMALERLQFWTSRYPSKGLAVHIQKNDYISWFFIRSVCTYVHTYTYIQITLDGNRI